MFIVIRAVKELAKANGKRVSQDYIEYLDKKVQEIIVSHSQQLVSKKTLSAKKAQALDVYRVFRE